MRKAGRRLLAGVALGGVFAVGAFAQAQSIPELILQIQRLQEILAALQSRVVPATPPQVVYQTPTTSVSVSPCELVRTLLRGMRGSDVTCVQEFLIARGLLPPDSATGFFGPLTESAVKTFQMEQGIVAGGTAATTGFGAIGPRTRESIRTITVNIVAVPQPTSPIPPTPPTILPPSVTPPPAPLPPVVIYPDNYTPLSCSFDGRTMVHNSSVTAYREGSVPQGQSCQAEERRCVNGALTGSYIFTSCTPTVATTPREPQDCIVGDVTIRHGESQTLYRYPVVNPGAQCAYRIRTCTDGILSGDATMVHPSCTTRVYSSCTLDGVTTAHSQAGMFYLYSSVREGILCPSRGRTCVDGVYQGDTQYVHGSCVTESANNCTLDGVTVASGSSRTFFSVPTVSFGESCGPVSQVRTCTNGVLSGESAFNRANCTPIPPVSCSFNGQTIAHNDAVTAYRFASVAAGGSCTSQQRICVNGTLSGSYGYSSCTVEAAANSCSFNSVSVPHGTSVTAYQASSVGFGETCQSQSRTCTNGTLSGSYQHASCAPLSASSCSFNNTSVPHGASVVAWQSASVPFGQTCTSQSRVCTNGTLSGSYAFSSCSAGSAASCSFNNQTVAHGSSVTAYETATVPFGQTCVSQQRTCSNGTLNGTYQYGSCTQGTASACTLDGVTVQHGQSATFYSASTVPFGQTCASVSLSRACSNAVLSGSSVYNRGSCSVSAAASCLFNGQTVSHNTSVTAYQSATVPFGQTCVSEQRTCSNGNLSGSFGHTGCTQGSDTTPPTVSLTSPTNGTTVSGSVTISANASDNNAVAGVQFRVDGVNVGSEDTTSPYSVSWNTAQSANGSRTVTAIARDAAGNTASAVARTVTVSNTYTSPTATPLPGTYTTTQTVTLAAGSGATIRYTTTTTDPTCSSGTTYSTPIAVSTTQTIRAIACYTNGQSAVTSFAYTINTPSGTSCSFNNQTVAHGSSVTAYQSSSLAFPGPCVSQQRTCTNGTLNGTYTHATCTVAEDTTIKPSLLAALAVPFSVRAVTPPASIAAAESARSAIINSTCAGNGGAYEACYEGVSLPGANGHPYFMWDNPVDDDWHADDPTEGAPSSRKFREFQVKPNQVAADGTTYLSIDNTNYDDPSQPNWFMRRDPYITYESGAEINLRLRIPTRSTPKGIVLSYVDPKSHFAIGFDPGKVYLGTVANSYFSGAQQVAIDLSSQFVEFVVKKHANSNRVQLFRVANGSRVQIGADFFATLETRTPAVEWQATRIQFGDNQDFRASDVSNPGSYQGAADLDFFRVRRLVGGTKSPTHPLPSVETSQSHFIPALTFIPNSNGVGERPRGTTPTYRFRFDEPFSIEWKMRFKSADVNEWNKIIFEGHLATYQVNVHPKGVQARMSAKPAGSEVIKPDNYNPTQWTCFRLVRPANSHYAHLYMNNNPVPIMMDIKNGWTGRGTENGDPTWEARVRTGRSLEPATPEAAWSNTGPFNRPGFYRNAHTEIAYVKMSNQALAPNATPCDQRIANVGSTPDDNNQYLANAFNALRAALDAILSLIGR